MGFDSYGSPGPRDKHLLAKISAFIVLRRRMSPRAQKSSLTYILPARIWQLTANSVNRRIMSFTDPVQRDPSKQKIAPVCDVLFSGGRSPRIVALPVVLLRTVGRWTVLRYCSVGPLFGFLYCLPILAARDIFTDHGPIFCKLKLYN